MPKQRHVLQWATLVLSLAGMTGCQAEKDRADQREAVQYTLVQHNSAECAQLGLLPGSVEFNDCMTRLQNGQPVTVTTSPSRTLSSSTTSK